MSKCENLSDTEWAEDQNFAAIDKAAPECVYCLDERQAKSDSKTINQLGR